MQEFKKLFPKIENFKKVLQSYCLKNDSAQDYYISINFLSAISEISFRDADYCKQVYNWITNGSTLELKQILYRVKFEEENLAHFNAFALIDSLRQYN